MMNERRKIKGKNEVVLLPPVDIYETDDAFILKCEMPGVEKDNIEILLDNDELTIKGIVKENGEDLGTLTYSEYRLYNYERKFRVGDNINGSAINASLDNGILTITLPKSEKVKPRKIEITFEK
ncbi:MAG: Hsp20/alpha crystallin family protein [Spirochaetes bacterium]|nr:Hsp20/alpha crystallin family protein [Spirochaetota bacterium]